MSEESEVTGGSCLIALLALPLVVMLHALALSYLWVWFVVPLGAPSLGMAHLYGLSVLAALVAGPYSPQADELNNATAQGVLRPLIALGAGFVIQAIAF